MRLAVHRRPLAACVPLAVVGATLATLAPATATAQAARAQAARPAADAVPGAMAQIREADLKRDLYAMAGDAMRGREAGTVDEMRASAWLVDRHLDRFEPGACRVRAGCVPGACRVRAGCVPASARSRSGPRSCRRGRRPPPSTRPPWCWPTRTTRSILFVYHGAEERGLLGSRWHAAHPVVPREKIAAVLDGDMIGRNHPTRPACSASSRRTATRPSWWRWRCARTR